MKNMTSILNTQELVKHYGSGEGVVKAVDHTSLEVRRVNSPPLSAVPAQAKALCFICWEDWTDLIPVRSLLRKRILSAEG